MGILGWKILSAAAALIIAVQAVVIVRLSDGRADPVPHAFSAEKVAEARPASTAIASGNRAPQVQPAAANALSATDRLAVLMYAKSNNLFDGVTVRGGGDRVSDEFAEAFALTPAERERLQRAMDAAKADVTRLEKTNASIRKESDTRYVVEVRSFPEKGGEIHDRLVKEFEAVLGRERTPAFHSLARESLEGLFGRMGASEKKLTISKEAATGFYNVKAEYRSIGEAWTATGLMHNFTDVEKHHPVVSGLFPHDFATKGVAK